MKLQLTLSLVFLIGCFVSKDLRAILAKTNYDREQTTLQTQACVRGTVLDPEKEPLIGATAIIYKGEVMLTGAVTDFDGKFSICIEDEGDFTLVITHLGMHRLEKEIRIRLGEILFLDDEQLTVEEEKIELLKPMIYLYPDDTIGVSVEVDCKGGLTHTYPKYADGWNVTANPEGVLIDENGRSYYGLYWEGNGIDDFTIDRGHVVKGDETITFLERALETLGLNEREANEFIVYWLPILEKNPYNLIHFSSEEYEQMSPLKITPNPDQVIRVMMVYEPLQMPIEIASQKLEKVKRLENGFVAVEWGGSRNSTALSFR